MRQLLLVALVLTLTCTRGDAPPQPPDIAGEITQVTAIAGGLSLRIEEVPTDSSGTAKAVVRADGTTRWSGLPLITGEIRTGAPTGVRAGMRVQVWFDGPAAMSYPVQAKAALIVVLTPR
ncbi:MAG TPA: DUF3221 domain-containing protein [Candidatus Limnocylindria bacterium]|nr:DUF3221 domain-containing protein [Candidatus Limnocylindria bacterium]